MANIGYTSAGKFQSWLYDQRLDRRKYVPVSFEHLADAAHALGLLVSERSGQKKMIVVFRPGVEYPPKGKIEKFLMRRYLWFANKFGPRASEYRYIYAENFSRNRGVEPAIAPAYILREAIAYEYDQEKIVGIQMRESLLYCAPSQEDFERWGSGDLKDPGKMLERTFGLPKEEVIPLPEPAVEIRRGSYDGTEMVFLSEAWGLVKERLARKEQELQEFKKEHEEFLRS